MARLARIVVAGMPHHVTQRGNRRQEVFFGDEDREEYLRYVERNPVRAKLARTPWSYRWSSAGFRVGQRRDDPLVRAEDRFGQTIKDWKAYLMEGEDQEQIDLIRKETPVGRPIGDAAFIQRLERRVGIDLFRRPSGPRPKKKKRGVR